MNLRKPVPITIEIGPLKLSGFIMKMTLLGMMVELEKIPFKVGEFVVGHFDLDQRVILSERLRSIKHYDKYFRKAPPKKLKEGQEVPVPKMLCELHFEKLQPTTKLAISKFLIDSKVK